MIKQYANIFRRVAIVADSCLVAIVFFVSYWLRVKYKAGLYSLDHYIGLCPIFVIFWGVSLYMGGIYKSFRLKSTYKILTQILDANLMAFVCFGAMIYVFKFVNISRSFIILAFVLTTFVLCLEKIVLIYYFREIRRRGLNFRNILIVGTKLKIP